MDLDMAALGLVSEKLITKLNAVPLFKRGNRLFVALSSPTNTQALDEFKFATGLSTEAVLVNDAAAAASWVVPRILGTTAADDIEPIPPSCW